ncbi:MAG: hypothetical protein EOP85_10955, partial [Verrucomicrobiaceae bacterium]
MSHRKYQLLGIAAMVAGLATSAEAAVFALPKDGPVAFRRDRVPLDQDNIGVLSRQLTGFVESMTLVTPEQLRGAAQTLALAIALDPSNNRARDLITDLRRSRHKPVTDAEEKLKADRARIWLDISWLESAEAGPDGQALAACLKDVVAFSDPGNPRSEPLLAAGQLGAWRGWIPPLSSYEDDTAPQKPDAGDPVTPAEPQGPELAEATVNSLLWIQRPNEDPEKGWEQTFTPLRMTAKAATTRSKRNRPFSVEFGNNERGSTLENLAMKVTIALQSAHGTLPDGIQLNIDGPGLAAAASSGKPLSIDAAAAVLASAALTGQEPDATILGTFDNNGAYVLPAGFWEQLRALEVGKTSRLILPAAAADYLPALLAFERPQFFLKYEVLLAKDFKEVLALAAKKPAGEAAN